MRSLKLIPAVAFTILTLAARVNGQAVAVSPSDAARSFFNMLDAKHWTDAAAMVDSASASAIREDDLAMMIAWAQHRAELERIMRRKGSGGLAGGFSSDGHVNPTLLAKYGSAPIRGFGGAPTLAAVAALSPREFVADVFALRDTMFNTSSAARQERFTYQIVGEVIEADTIAHVLYRVGGTRVHAPDPLQVSVLRFRRRGDRWLADLTVLDYEILGGGVMFMEMNDTPK